MCVFFSLRKYSNWGTIIKININKSQGILQGLQSIVYLEIIKVLINFGYDLWKCSSSLLCELLCYYYTKKKMFLIIAITPESRILIRSHQNLNHFFPVTVVILP